MKSIYIIFPEKERVEVHEEFVAPPGPGEVLCAAITSLVSVGTETACLRGIFDPGTNWADWVRYPFRPGYCMVGRVIAIGEGSAGLKEGDRITSRTPHQQFFTVRPQDAYVLPSWVSHEEAAWARLSVTAQLGVRRAELQLGESVGVIGLGLLGQLVVQYLVLSGARRVIAIDLSRERLDMAAAHGATHTIATDARNARDEVARITRGKMLDAVVEVTGHPAVLSAAVQLVRRLGRVVLLGDTPTPSQQYLGPGVVSNSIAILGIHGTMSPAQSSEFAPWSREEMTHLFFDYLAQGRMRVADLITHRFSPQDAPQMYARLLQGDPSMVGVLLDWTKLRG